MSRVGGGKAVSTESLIWEAQAAARELELATKRDHAIESRSRFDEAVRERRAAAEARFQKGGRENRSSFWSTVGTVAGLVLAAVAACVLAVPTGGVSLEVAALVALTGGGTAALAKLLCFVAWDRHTGADERRASESEVRATEAQRAADAAKEEAQAAQERFRGMIEEARALDQVRLRAAQER